jgi:uroporphyrinogen III methyltransferase/synthase
MTAASERPGQSEAEVDVTQATEPLEALPPSLSVLSVWQGLRVLLPRTEEQGEASARLLRERGALPLVLPTIRVEPPPDPELARSAARRVETYDLLLFTSANSVRCFAGYLGEVGKGPGALPLGGVYAVGPATARALEAWGLQARSLPSRFVAEGLLELLEGELSELRARLVGREPRVLLPRALEAREVLPEGLRALGCEVDVVPVYATRPVSGAQREALLDALRRRQVDVVLLTSGSIAHSLSDALASDAPGEEATALLQGVCIASLGPITTAAAEVRGLRVSLTSPSSSLPALLDALELWLARRAETARPS